MTTSWCPAINRPSGQRESGASPLGNEGQANAQGHSFLPSETTRNTRRDSVSSQRIGIGGLSWSDCARQRAFLHLVTPFKRLSTHPAGVRQSAGRRGIVVYLQRPRKPPGWMAEYNHPCGMMARPAGSGRIGITPASPSEGSGHSGVGQTRPHEIVGPLRTRVSSEDGGTPGTPFSWVRRQPHFLGFDAICGLATRWG